MLQTRQLEDRKKISRQEKIDLLNEHKESVFKDIANNISYRQIAENYNIHLTNLHHYLNLEETVLLAHPLTLVHSYHFIYY